MVKGKNWLHWVMLIVMMFSFSSPAAAQAPSDETEVLYIADIFDGETRSAIAATGALILEAGHDYILVEATQQEKKAIERHIGKTIARPTLEQALLWLFHLPTRLIMTMRKWSRKSSRQRQTTAQSLTCSLWALLMRDASSGQARSPIM